MTLQLLQSNDLAEFRALMIIFAQAFEDDQTYVNQAASDEYIQGFLSSSSHIVLVAKDERANVIGGLVAYELHKFERSRKEIFVYDLAVSALHRRRGVGTSLFVKLKKIASQRQAYLIFVQAVEADKEAISFYRSLTDKELLARHFEITV